MTNHGQIDIVSAVILHLHYPSLSCFSAIASARAPIPGLWQMSKDSVRGKGIKAAFKTHSKNPRLLLYKWVPVQNSLFQLLFYQHQSTSEVRIFPIIANPQRFFYKSDPDLAFHFEVSRS